MQYRNVLILQKYLCLINVNIGDLFHHHMMSFPSIVFRQTPDTVYRVEPQLNSKQINLFISKIRHSVHNTLVRNK